MGDLPHLPLDIKIDIFRRLGKSGFSNLGSVIAAGREGRDAVFTREVLSEAKLDVFMFFGALTLEGSLYRSFLLKCVHNGNIQARYIEAVRMFKQEGASSLAYEYLNEAMGTNTYAIFALAMFAFCSGSWEEGFGVLSQLWDKVNDIHGAVLVAHTVIGQIATMGLPPTGLYENTYEYPEVPWCVYVSCNLEDMCEGYYSYWYSRLICAMC